MYENNIGGLGSGLMSNNIAEEDYEYTSSLYQRPADWLNLPVLSEGDQKLVGLYAVYNTDTNFISFKCQGAYTVDWGDGSVSENIDSNVMAYHNYSYASFDDTSLCSRGYRQSIVTITPQEGQNLTKIDLGKSHNQAGLPSVYSSGWLDIAIVGANISILQLYPKDYPYVIRHSNLEIFNYIGTNVITSCLSLFGGCSSLQKIENFDTSSSQNFSYMFSGCTKLEKIPQLNTSNGTNFSYMFKQCRNLKYVGHIDTSKATTLTYMFQDCFSIKELPMLDFSNNPTVNAMLVL
jgi:hypothetical protein